MGRRVRQAGVRLKGLNASGQWPSGNVRYYYRASRGAKQVPLPDLPREHPDFLRAYADAAGGMPEPAARTAPGSTGAGIVAYLKSDSFLGLAPATRAQRRRICDDIRKRYGDMRLSGWTPTFIRRDLARLDPHPANNRLKVWRALGRFWLDSGLLEMDIARDVRPRAAPKSEGFTPWTREDVAAFRAHWPVETPQRMAMELIYRSCAAIGDACRLGPGNVSDGWLTYRRSKSASEATCPFTVPGPAWFEATDDLAACLRHAPNALTYLATAGGRPRSAKAATQWFSGACREAGLEAGKTAHGLRKHRASVFRENGASEDQRMAILGHETKEEAHRYSRSADLRRVVQGTPFPNSEPLPNSGSRNA